jgi:hypothetical protein
MSLELFSSGQETTFLLTLGDQDYSFTEDVKGNLMIKGGHVNIHGNGHRILGWVHAEITGGTIADLTVVPQRLIDFTGKCEICDKKNELKKAIHACFALCSGNNVVHKNITLLSPVPLNYFALSEKTATARDCIFNGIKFNDPPESGYVLRV